jgi:Uncharacterized conserved protein
MQPHAMDEKLKEFEKTLKRYLSSKGIKSIELHALRLKSRELYSLCAREEDFAKEVKKILKYSNSLRDMDVFEEVYLASLPKTYRAKLPVKQIKEQLQAEREADTEALHTYLCSFRMPQKTPSAHVPKKQERVLPKLPEYEKRAAPLQNSGEKILAQEKTARRAIKKRSPI